MESNRRKNNSSRIKVIVTCSMMAVMTFSANVSSAQTWGEFFEQKETQKKYLLEQIAALQLYAGYLGKGYEIAGTGLQAIKGFSKGEFDLHHDFLASLKDISPGLKDNTKVAEMIWMQIEISRILNRMNRHPLLSSENLAYIHRVKDHVLKDCTKDLEELFFTVNPGKINMTDDERMKRMGRAYGSMKDKYAFTQSFFNEIKLLIRQREQETKSLNQIHKLYETN